MSVTLDAGCHVSFDIMDAITSSKRLGFLETGGDIDDLMASIWSYFRKPSPVSPEQFLPGSHEI